MGEGDLTVSVRIGPIGVCLRPAGRECSTQLRRLYRPFLSPPDRSSWRIRLHTGGPLRTKSAKPMLIDDDDRFSVRCSRFEAGLDCGKRTGDLRARSPWATGVFLRAFLSHLLPRQQGLLLHSAGGTLNGRAFVFPGRSGSGKSTLARLFAPGRLLSDELVVVTQTRGRWRAHGTPFHGDVAFASADAAPLRGIFFPEKSDAWQILALGRAEAVRKLLKCIVCFGTNKPEYSRILGCVSDLAVSVPFFRLRFAKSLPPGRTLESVLSGPCRA